MSGTVEAAGKSPPPAGEPAAQISQHIITIEKVAKILARVGWERWAKSREEQQLLAQHLIELRSLLKSML